MKLFIERVWEILWIKILEVSRMKRASQVSNNSKRRQDEGHSMRRMFSKEEDSMISLLVSQYGNRNWKLISKKMIRRTPRQCRERWRYYLSPNVDNRPWSEDEDNMLVDLMKTMGTQWSKIAKHFEHRTCINVKNRYCLLQRNNRKNKNFAPVDKADQLGSSEQNMSSEETEDVSSPNNFMNNMVIESNRGQIECNYPNVIDFWGQDQWDMTQEVLLKWF